MGLNPERMKASEPERDMIRFAFLKALCGKREKETAGEAGMVRRQVARDRVKWRVCPGI